MVNPKDLTDEQYLEYLEELEEQEDFTEACRVANKNLWLCDDGGV
jgi:hypothetical protein